MEQHLPAPPSRKATAIAMMKRASRDTFKLCAEQAEELALQIENGSPMDGAAALRLLATLFRWSARHE